MVSRHLTAALLFAALPAAAADVCVSSVVSLQNALTTAGNNDEADVIRVVQGTYALTGPLIYSADDSFPLELLGGYSPGCTTRTLDPNNTIIDGADVLDRRVVFAALERHHRGLLLQGPQRRQQGRHHARRQPALRRPHSHLPDAGLSDAGSRGALPAQPRALVVRNRGGGDREFG